MNEYNNPTDIPTIEGTTPTTKKQSTMYQTVYGY